MIQHVKIVKYEKPYYFGKLVGLVGNGIWKRRQLHPPRVVEVKPRAWKNGDRVQFQIEKPRFGITRDGQRIKIEDGTQCAKGLVWCKGIIVSVVGNTQNINRRKYEIGYNAWDLTNEEDTQTGVVGATKIRNPYEESKVDKKKK